MLELYEFGLQNGNGKMLMNLKLKMVAVGLVALSGVALSEIAKPNIVFVLCDDLGYGDIQCLNPERGKIKTPNVDQLAGEGMVFTDAHTSSSVCTPSRYGLLTGRYSWRSVLQSGVVSGFKPDLIAEDRPTVASFLREQGYRTAIIGKWHLNFEYLDPETSIPLKKGEHKIVPLGCTIPDGPVTRGFDYYHGFHHARDMKGIIENDRVIEHDEEINMLPRLERKAVAFIDECAADADTPFFLYVPFGSPHTPIVPSPEWQGKSGLNPYADFVMQTDAAFGSILDALDRNGLTENTLVIFSSDNGCSKAANFKQLNAKGHYPSAYMRGSKSDIWDGGHRVPFVVRWPGQVAAGSNSDQLICLTDFFASVAEITGTPLPVDGAEDSVSFVPALSGEPIFSTRNGVIHHSISGHFAYRFGKWKLCLARSSGGWSLPKEDGMPEGSPSAQLYNLEEDPGETTNVVAAHPEVVERLLALLTADVEQGRSTEGAPAHNDVNRVELWKSGQ